MNDDIDALAVAAIHELDVVMEHRSFQAHYRIERQNVVVKAITTALSEKSSRIAALEGENAALRAAILKHHDAPHSHDMLVTDSGSFHRDCRHCETYNAMVEAARGPLTAELLRLLAAHDPRACPIKPCPTHRELHAAESRAAHAEASVARLEEFVGYVTRLGAFSGDERHVLLEVIKRAAKALAPSGRGGEET